MAKATTMESEENQKNIPASADRAGSSTPEVAVPERPLPRVCPAGCGKLIEPFFIDPVVLGGKVLKMSNRWEFNDLCDDCHAVESKNQADKEAKMKLDALIASAGYEAKHQAMSYDNMLKHLAPMVAVSHAYVTGGYNLFLTGACGPGKTHLAVCLHRERIQTNLLPGRLEIVPELLDNFRQAIREKRDAVMVDQLCNLDSLILDDLGVGRPTEYALERLYIMIDRFWRKEKKGLIITSNLSLEQVSDQLDDRIASRIADMCRILEIKGPDCRVRKK